MTVNALDTLLAAKVINIMPGLRPSDRKVALALIEHFNRKTGRCDPGIQRIASLLDCCTRTVIRATNRLEKLGLFEKDRHGGYSNRNRYRPNWKRLAEHEAAWKSKLHRSRRSKVSPETRQAGHLESDSAVTQTCSRILPKQTYSRSPAREERMPQRSKLPIPRAADAARTEAERRWSNDLLEVYAGRPVTYAEIVDAIDVGLSAAATEAELSQHGAGLRLIQRRLKLQD
ncbi:MAG TPA: helix-turn-helix domain-containing protein [Pseudolabrys sp.]|uniref:helix-turn-helix domain-containing protein n=1 Tax=Pseudolabrys sp. TaxID=1960880 RepID=UPI002DDD317C|nr:helix-turn-helix domain-containing protein [Pseudolabrys sp.]HEV2630825.1 helix-turn-helix domain-containing protein [Pseudolabrys sp.]